jgi:hypothetical protein
MGGGFDCMQNAVTVGDISGSKQGGNYEAYEIKKCRK